MSLLDEITKTRKELEKSKLEMFTGIRVVVDDNLPPNRWYMAVSKDILEALRKTDIEFKDGKE